MVLLPGPERARSQGSERGPLSLAAVVTGQPTVRARLSAEHSLAQGLCAPAP